MPPITGVCKPYAKSSCGKSWQVYRGDCIDVMKDLSVESVDLIFADPPFNIGYKYDIYEDVKSLREYCDWSCDWVKRCWNLLKPNGSFFLAMGLQFQSDLKTIAALEGFCWRDTIAWHYTFGPRQESKLTPSWVPIHYFTKNKKDFTWNKEEIRVPSARQTKYNDKRAVGSGKLPNNLWVLDPTTNADVFQPHHNAMLESRVCGTFKERTAHPCQMPQALLERIVLMASNPGDVVFDPFLGSGTTLAAAIKLGRVGRGVELSENYLREICLPRLRDIVS